MRAVLDTNIFISALVSPSGAPSRLVDAWIDGEFTLCSHALQLDELRNVTRREKLRPLIRSSDAGRLINQIMQMAEMANRLPHVQRSRDPNDDFLLALCEAGNAEWLVTGDKADLLTLERHGPTRIVTAARLAEELGL
jgi:uncharacterized protein